MSDEIKNEVSDHIDDTITTATTAMAAKAAADAAYAAATTAAMSTGAAGVVSAGIGAAAGVAAYKVYKAGKEFVGLAKDEMELAKNEHKAEVADKAVEIKKQNPDKPVADCYEEAEKQIYTDAQKEDGMPLL